MAAEVRPTSLVKLPAGPAPLTPEQLYWKSFRSQVTAPSPTGNPIQYVHAPTYAATTPSSSADLFAVTTGARVQLFSARTRKVVKTITRFTDTAYGAQIRKDGRVFVAGEQNGQIQVFDVASRAILKTWRDHKQAVWRTAWNPADMTSLLSTSDDLTVRLWDLPSDEPITKFLGHEDYVRSGAFLGGQAQGLLVSGSYDQTVKVWDPRAPRRAVMTFKHAGAVEEVLPMPSGKTVLAAAGNTIAVLDLIGGKPVNLMENHQKTVTSLALARNGSRLVAGGLDGHVKIFETEHWNVVTGIKYPSPILSLGVVSSNVGKEDRHLAVGMLNGTLSIRTRLTGEAKVKAREKAKEMAALEAGEIDKYDKQKARKERMMTGGWQARLRGKNFTGEGADIIIEGNPRPRTKLNQWQKALHKGNHALALDRALQTGELQSIVTVLVALRHRSAMREALEKRDESSIQPILKFVCKYIVDPRQVAVCVEVGILLLDIYAEHAGQSRDVDQLWKRLYASVKAETDRAQEACQTQGMLGILMEG